MIIFQVSWEIQKKNIYKKGLPNQVLNYVSKAPLITIVRDWLINRQTE